MQKNKQLIIPIAILLVASFLIGMYIGQKETQKPQMQLSSVSQNSIKIGLVGIDNKGNGIPAQLTTAIRNGTGQVLVNINDILADYSTQLSARTAAQYAANFTKTDLNSIDVVYSIKADAGLISGPSAGSAMAVSAIALMQNKTINNSVVITGTINSDGTIGKVSGIAEKAKAAKEIGTLFLIPQDNDIVSNYIESRNCYAVSNAEYCKITYVPANITTNLGIKFVEVSNVTDALRWFYEEK